jgi:DNA-binding CsgD family transcriptional regulator/N-acetylneuraminic acid mutarotase
MTTNDFEELSERELDVLRCVVESGASNKEIAAELTISQNTVKVHLRNIYAKLGVSSRTEAATMAIQQGLVTIPGLDSAVPEREPAAKESETAVPTPPEAETATADPIPATRPLQPARLADRFWFTTSLVIGVAGLLLFSLLGLLWLGGNFDTAAPAESTSIPFRETPIGDGRWAFSRPLPIPQAGMSVAAVGLTLYQIGGETAEGVVNATLAYDTGERQWQERAAKPTAVTEAGAAVLFGEIYVVGGRLANGQPTNVVEAYSPSQNGWRLITPLPQPISGGVALADGGFLYLFGGWNGQAYVDTAYVYDPGSDNWRPLPPLSQPRAFAAGGAIAGRLYVVGGYDGTAELTTCEYFDPVQGRWFDCTPLLQPRAGAAAIALVNRLYVLGGRNDDSLSYSEVYDPNSGNWQVINTPVLENAASWSDLGAANVETRIYLLGGRLDGELLAAAYVFTPIYQTFIPSAVIGPEE